MWLNNATQYCLSDNFHDWPRTWVTTWWKSRAIGKAKCQDRYTPHYSCEVSLRVVQMMQNGSSENHSVPGHLLKTSPEILTNHSPMSLCKATYELSIYCKQPLKTLTIHLLFKFFQCCAKLYSPKMAFHPINPFHSWFHFPSLRNQFSSQAWWCTSVLPVLRKWRQKNHKFESSLGHIVTSCLKKEERSRPFLSLDGFITIMEVTLGDF
jgi:hypothetical protein